MRVCAVLYQAQSYAHESVRRSECLCARARMRANCMTRSQLDAAGVRPATACPHAQLLPTHASTHSTQREGGGAVLCALAVGQHTPPLQNTGLTGAQDGLHIPLAGVGVAAELSLRRRRSTGGRVCWDVRAWANMHTGGKPPLLSPAHRSQLPHPHRQECSKLCRHSCAHRAHA